MENIVVVSFQNIGDANGAINQLRELDEIGDIVIYNQVLIRKDKENQYASLFHEGPATVNLPAGGTLFGAIIGLVGGPIGATIGGLTGVLAGTFNQNHNENLYKEILNRVKNYLQEGHYALIVDVEEDNSFTIDSYLSEFNAKIIRMEWSAVCNDYDVRRRSELDDEIVAEEMAFEKAAEKDKAAFKTQISLLRARRDERIQKFKAGRELAKKQLHEKIENLNTKIKTADNKRKTRLETHKVKVEEKLQLWSKEASAVFI
jgi:uncharacterized membrane protein